MVIAHPGQNVELLCSVTPSGGQTVAWIIDNEGLYTTAMAYSLDTAQNGM